MRENFKLEKASFQLWYINDEVNETFRRITVSSNFLVSNKGRKLAMSFGKKDKTIFNPKILANINVDGRDRFYFYVNGTHYQPLVSREVLLQFGKVVSNVDSMEANHISGIVSDDRFENLEFVTPSQNVQHAIENGHNNYEHLSVADKKEIIRLHLLGFGYGKMSKKLDIKNINGIANVVRSYKKGNLKVIRCVTTDMTFDNLKDASSFYKTHISAISQCCNGNVNYAGRHPETNEKLLWKYEYINIG